MKIAFLSDVHANLEALLAVRKKLQDLHPEKIFFLGDIVGYGANPNECIEIIRELADFSIAGNHDWTAVGNSSAESFNPSARHAIDWTRDRMSAASIEYIDGLPLQKKTKFFLCTHATPENPQDWGYIFTDSDAAASFGHFAQPLCFIGHTHYPAIFTLRPDGDIDSDVPLHARLQKNCRYIINNGSVGQPRDGNAYASFGMLDTASSEYTLVRVRYDVETAQTKIIAAGLPHILAERLERGR